MAWEVKEKEWKMGGARVGNLLILKNFKLANEREYKKNLNKDRGLEMMKIKYTIP